MKTRFLALALIAAVLLTLGSIAEDGADDDAQTPSRWLDLLRHIPDTPETREATWALDYERAREIFNVELPPPGAGEEAVLEYLEEMWRESGLLPPAEAWSLKYLPLLTSDLGFTYADVAQEIYGWETYLALRGRFEKTRVDEAVQKDELFGGQLEPRSHGGVSYYAWKDASPERRVEDGAPGRVWRPGHALALNGDVAYWTDERREASVEDMIDASLGNRESLADAEDYRLLAGALDKPDTYFASFLGEPSPLSYAVRLGASLVYRFNVTYKQEEAVEHLLRSAPLLLRYDAFAVARGSDAGGIFEAAVLVHPDEETARSNARLLGERISEAPAIGGQPYADLVRYVRISTEGRLLLVRFRRSYDDTFPDHFWEALLAYDDAPEEEGG